MRPPVKAQSRHPLSTAGSTGVRFKFWLRVDGLASVFAAYQNCHPGPRLTGCPGLEPGAGTSKNPKREPGRQQCIGLIRCDDCKHRLRCRVPNQHLAENCDVIGAQARPDAP